MKKIFLLLAAVCGCMAFATCGETTDDVEERPGPSEGSGDDGTETPVGAVLLEESFYETLGAFRNETTSGEGAWRIDYHTACASGYNNTTKETKAGTFYLISPALNLKNVKAAHVAYEYVLRYKRSDANQRVLITSAYNGNAAMTGWTELTRTHQQTPDYDTFAAADVEIPATFLGKENVRLAFFYNAEESGSSTWEVRNLKVATGKAGEDGGGDAIASEATDSASVVRRLEMPALADGSLFVRHIADVEGASVVNYCIEYDPQKMHSRWVAFRFDAVTRQRNATRSDKWADDPELPVALQIGTATFPGYDRGHLCASADRLFTQGANEQTFYMSNMSPQLNGFNSGLWNAFEMHVQDLGRDASFADTLYVAKGGTIAEGQTIGDLQRANGSFVAIPKYYWMALLRVKDGAYDAIGFWMEHKAYSFGQNASKAQKASFAVTIDELEQKTGIDFFHNLPDATEATVEAGFSLSAWRLE